MSSTADVPAAGDGEQEPSRRDFIHLMAGGAAAAAGLGIAIPIVHQMNPDASVRALATKEVDIGAVEVGSGIKVMWQGKPVFVRRRTQKEIEEARATPLGDLKDKASRNENLTGSEDATDENRVIQEEWMVVVGICTHLGCVPLGTQEGDSRGDYGGWFCPCHGSHYDTSGRIRKGPAPDNLDVPPYSFLTDTTIRIG